MSKETADIFGKKGASFTITLDAASISEDGAILVVDNQPDQNLTVNPNGHEVAVPSLPAGDSVVSLALTWAPGETRDATIDVGKSTPIGAVQAATPKHTIDLGDAPGEVELFGE
jgi:hypothetical protein